MFRLFICAASGILSAEESELDRSGPNDIQKMKRHDKIKEASTPYMISLFLSLAFLMDWINLLESTVSFWISYKFFRVEFSSLCDWPWRLNLMSLAISSHSYPTCFASSRCRLFCRRTRSCFLMPSWVSRSSISWQILEVSMFEYHLIYLQLNHLFHIRSSLTPPIEFSLSTFLLYRILTCAC